MKRYDMRSTNSATTVGGNMFESDLGNWVWHADALAAIEQARREEREACALLVETLHETSWPDTIAAAIRARGTIVSAQQQLPADMADVMRQAGDSLIDRGEGK